MVFLISKKKVFLKKVIFDGAESIFLPFCSLSWEAYKMTPKNRTKIW